MQALNRATEDAADFTGMMDKITRKAEEPRNLSREVDEWNERVDREKFEKARAKKIYTAELANLARG